MSEKKIACIISIAASLLLFFQVKAEQSTVVGWGLLALFFFSTAYLARLGFHTVYGLRKKSLVTWILSFFLSLVSFVSFLAPWVVWYRVLPVSLAVAAVLTSVFLFVFASLGKGKEKDGDRLLPRSIERAHVFHNPVVIISLFLISELVLFLLLLQRGGEAVETPWQALHPWVLPLYFFTTFFLGYIVFSRCKIESILFLIVLHSLVSHLYIPLSHPIPLGADAWRHMANESVLVQGDPVYPVLFGGGVKWQEVRGVPLPEALVIPNKYLYGQFWGFVVAIARVTGVSLLSLHIWLMPLLWAVVFPILLFYLGRLFFGTSAPALFLSYLGGLPFTFQAVGSLTLPNSFGFLVFLLIFALIISAIRSGRSVQAIIPVTLGWFLAFGYSLYFFLFLFVSFLFFAIRILDHSRSRVLSVLLFTSLFFVSLLFIPTIDLLVGKSTVPLAFDPIGRAAYAVSSLSGFGFASHISEQDSADGNILFNHTPTSAVVSSPFFTFRWHLVGFVFLVTMSVIVAFGIFLFSWSRLYRLFGFLTLLTFGGYSVGWYVLEGERLFTRRLDPLIGLFCIISFTFALFRFIEWVESRWYVERIRLRVVSFVALLLLAWAGTTVYASGPDIRSVSRGEYTAGTYLGSYFVHTADEHSCVLSSMWSLLPLESETRGRIIGGGFPLDLHFGATSRDLLLARFVDQPEKKILDDAHTLTGAEKCFLVVPEADVTKEKRKIIDGIFGGTSESLGGFSIWHE